MCPFPMKGLWNVAVAGYLATEEASVGSILGEVLAFSTNMVKGGKMEIIVCIKQVLDRDLPPAKFLGAY